MSKNEKREETHYQRAGGKRSSNEGPFTDPQNRTEFRAGGGASTVRTTEEGQADFQAIRPEGGGGSIGPAIGSGFGGVVGSRP